MSRPHHLEQNHVWNTAIELPQQSYSRKNSANRRILPDFSCFAGWEHSHRNNCLQDENHEKTHQRFHRKHGHVGSAVSDFLVPSGDMNVVHRLRADYSVLMKDGHLLANGLLCCIYSEPGSDSSGSIWSCGVSFPVPTHQFKVVPVLHSRHLDHWNGFFLPISFRPQSC